MKDLRAALLLFLLICFVGITSLACADPIDLVSSGDYSAYWDFATDGTHHAVPEPSTFTLLGIGIVSLIGWSFYSKANDVE